MQFETLDVPGCIGTKVEPVASNGGLQVLRVEVAAGGLIPLHSHECAAVMVITKGKARTLGKDGRVVAKGDVVIKAANEAHGFCEVDETFEFMSISGGDGILSPTGWNMSFS